MRTLPEGALEAAVASFNAKHAPRARVEVEEHDADAFVLRFLGPSPDEPVEDDRFGEMQWLLKEQTGEDTEIHGGEWDRELGAYRIHYAVVDWDG